MRKTCGLWVLALVAVLSGCLVGGSHEETRTGHYVSDETLAQIKPGKTTAAWVLATLGEPDKKSKADDAEVWKWTYTEKRESDTAVFLIFGGSDKKVVNGAVFVEIRNGVVTRTWRG